MSSLIIANSKSAPMEQFVQRTGSIIAGYCLGEINPGTLMPYMTVQSGWSGAWKRDLEAEAHIAKLFAERVFAYSMFATDLFRYRSYPTLLDLAKEPLTKELLDAVAASMKRQSQTLSLDKGAPNDAFFNFSFIKQGTLFHIKDYAGFSTFGINLCYEDRLFALSKSEENRWALRPLSHRLALAHELTHALHAEDRPRMAANLAIACPVDENQEEARTMKGEAGDTFYEVAFARAFGEGERVTYRGFNKFDNDPKNLQLLTAMAIGADDTVLELMKEGILRTDKIRVLKKTEAELDKNFEIQLREGARNAGVPYAIYKTHPKLVARIASLKKSLVDDVSAKFSFSKLFDLSEIAQYEKEIADIYLKSYFDVVDSKNPKEKAFLIQQNEHIEFAYVAIIESLKEAGHQEIAARIEDRVEKAKQRDQAFWAKFAPTLEAFPQKLAELRQKYCHCFPQKS